MPLKIQSTKDIGVDSVKILVYGASGSGKTRLIGTSPNPLIISTEKGLLTLRDMDIPYLQANNFDELQEAFDIAKKSDYDTIALDSISEVTELLLAKYKDELASKDKRQAYLQMAETGLALIRNFRDMPEKNVIFTCKETKREDEELGTTNYEPGLPGRVLPDNISYMFDEVFCMRVERKGRYLQTASDTRRNCKDRSGNLDSKELPDLKSIFSKIRG